MSSIDQPSASPPVASRFTLRQADPDDAPALAKLGRESFCAAFGHLYKPEDLAAFLEESHAEGAVAQAIADPANTYRLADDGARLLAFCKLCRPASFGNHSDAENPIALSQLYTRPELTGAGLGAALMDWALGEARSLGCDAIQLSVWSGNHAAQRFYARYGFAKIADIDFWVGSQRDDEFLYELRLVEG
ncbi:MAG: acetyltransferase [Sphingomonadales bacterium BRH_c42]|nr:MAG: acetyltransferase [Sphingomonadales bacterium BRH_c42]